MIEKIISIQNVGKFADYHFSGDKTLRKLTLVYGENGGGKTTLTNILRCLQANDPTLLLKRKTLGRDGNPGATLLISGSHTKLQDTGWTNPFNDLAIYDATFITENVHSGEEVEHVHRENLHRLAIGDAGVKLARDIEKIDADSRTLSSEIHELENQIRAATATPNVVNFAKIESVKDNIALSAIKNRIEELKRKSQQIANIDSIRNKAVPEVLSIPQLPIKDIESILGKTVDNLNSDAEVKVREHLASNLNKGGAEWISDGYHKHHKSDNCPFCAQPLNKSSIFEAYKTFFSDVYAQIKADISKKKDILNSIQVFNPLKNLQLNSEIINSWENLQKFELPKLDSIAIEKTHNEALSSLKGAIRQKTDEPLNSLNFTDKDKASFATFNDTISQLEKYNDAVKVILQSIIDFKATLEKTDVIKLKEELNYNELSVKRSEPPVDELCKKYILKVTAKDNLQKYREETKKKLNENTKAVIEQFQEAINVYLEKFGAGFRIIKAKEEFPAGQVCLNYQLQINDTPFDINAPKKNPHAPCFKTCLSSGDKSSLAFAFFLAKLDADPKLADKVVVFDDPITSLDANREARTCHNIVRLVSRAKQVIVLSHDSNFLRNISESVPNNQTKTLQVARQGKNDSKLDEWDIKTETIKEYCRDKLKLEEYLIGENSCDLHDAARCLRPVLEKNIRDRFPGVFQKGEGLGHFLDAIRAATPPNPLMKMQPFLEELGAINDFSKSFHHGNDSDGEKPHPIKDAELKTYANATMKFINGEYS